MPLAERVSDESSNETEMIKASVERALMEVGLQATRENENFVSEITHGSLSFVDRCMKLLKTSRRYDRSKNAHFEEAKR